MSTIEHIDETLLATLRADEEFRSRPYRCSAGKLTIGYGRNLEDTGITQDEAEFLLRGNVAHALRVAMGYAWFRRLSSTRQRVIVEMVFQLGPAGFHTFRNMRRALSDEDYQRAAEEMLDSKWAKLDTPQRAQRAADRMRRG